MPSRKGSSRQKRPVKRLLDGIMPKKSTCLTPVVTDLATDNSQSQSSNDVVTSSSSMLKRHEEEVKKDQGTSPDPTLPIQAPTLLQLPLGQQTVEDRQPVSANKEFFYTPIYRRYFGLTPPNPRLFNPRLLEDYIDWYMNVYLEEEELPWQWIYVGNATERAKRDEDEAKEEAQKLASTSSPSTEQP